MRNMWDLCSLVKCRRLKWFRYILLAVCVLGLFQVFRDLREEDVQIKKVINHSADTRNHDNQAGATTAISPLAPPKDRGPEVKVILLTYMRSGSTFTGDLFNQHPQVFYYYEPLWSFDFHFKKNRTAHFLDQDPVRYNPRQPGQVSALHQSTISNILSCAFRKVTLQVYEAMKHAFPLQKSKPSLSFGTCYRKSKGVLGLQACFPLLEDACFSAKMSVVKTVRFALKDVAALLKADPKVKVIHLVRDPRGILRSRVVSKIVSNYHMTGGQLCSQIQQDVKDSERLKKEFPGRILTARYEDLADRPLHFAERLLSFTGLEMTEGLRQHVWNQTSSGNVRRQDVFGTARSDSRTTASRWRLAMKHNEVASIDKQCSSLYDGLGYVPFPNEGMLKNLSVPAYKDLEQLPWLWSA